MPSKSKAEPPKMLPGKGEAVVLQDVKTGTVSTGKPTNQPHKPKVTPTARGRDMKFYYVDKRDIALIGQASVRATFCFSFAAFFFSLWLDITSSIAFSGSPLTPEANVLKDFRPYSLVIALAIAGLGIFELWTKGAWWRALREEHGETLNFWGKEVTEKDDDDEE